MPFIDQSTYVAKGVFRHPHVNTIFPAVFRKVKGVDYQRERLMTPDGDFVDLDWVRKKENEQLIIVLHGLEGSADRSYVRGLIKYFHHFGWDGIGFNFRGCSGELNQKIASYHMGMTQDLDLVIKHALEHCQYRTIILAGFSLGGNVVLKFLGDSGKKLPAEVKGAVTFSVPCHIASANEAINRRENALYRYRFIKSLYQKVEKKAALYPDKIKLHYPRPRYFKEFDDLYTAPIHGFKDAIDYWERCSSFYVIPQIKIPTLLINAKDDSFLSKECYPISEAEKNTHFFLEVPRWGGHVGFVSKHPYGAYWSEIHALQFVKEKILDKRRGKGPVKIIF